MKKLVSIDYMKALSMLYIVAFWHMLDYIDSPAQYANFWTRAIVKIVLGLFVFISGYLSGGVKSQSLSPLDFYRKRLIRIYPLYALAIGLFYLFEINGGRTSILALLGVSMYYGPPPATLWFITMIVVFYLLTPFLLKLANKPLLYLASASLVFAATVLIYFNLGKVDLRIVLYFPCFIAGLYCSIHGIINRVFNLKTMMLVFGLWLPLSYYGTGLLAPDRLGYMPLVLSMSYLLFYGFYQNERHLKNSKIVMFLSYGSFAMYLFHRPIYMSVTSLYLPDREWLQIPYLLAVFTLLIATISWSLQKTYDAILSALLKPT